MPSLSFRSDIQGLRAIAVLMVIVFHYNPALLPGGFVGVDVFFVISGFLITRILIKRQDQSDYTVLATLKYFYFSRIRRLIPAYFTMLTVVAVVASIIMLPRDFEVFNDSLNKAVSFASNTFFASFTDYFAPASHEQPLLHTWSLAIEIQYYLLAPFLLLIVPHRFVKWLLGMLVVSFTLIAEHQLRMPGSEQPTYYGFYARLPEFFLGSLAGLYFKPCVVKKVSNTCLSYTGVILLIGAAIFQPQAGLFPGLSALLPVVGTVILLAVPARGFLENLFNGRAVLWIGELSYSLYLWHWPILAFLRYYTGEQVLPPYYGLLFFFATLILSSASYYLVEKPMRSKSISIKQGIRWGSLFFVMLSVSISLEKLNDKYTHEQLSVEYKRYADPTEICHGSLNGDCLKGDLHSHDEILVLGDSHAAMLNLFFDYLGKEMNFKARVITASSCVTVPGFDYKRIVEWARKPCVSQIEESKKHYPNAQKIFLAASWNWQMESGAFQHAVASFVKEVASNGATVYVLAQEPLIMQNPQRLLRFNNLGMPTRNSLNLNYVRSNRILEDLAKESKNIIYLDLGGLPLFENAPFYNGELMYFDRDHINEVGILKYAEQALPVFRELFK